MLTRAKASKGTDSCADGQQLPGDCKGHGPKRLGFCGLHERDHEHQPDVPEHDLTDGHAPGVVAKLEAVLKLPKGDGLAVIAP